MIAFGVPCPVLGSPVHGRLGQIKLSAVQWLFSGLETMMRKDRLRAGFAQSGEGETLLSSTAT